MIFVQFFVLASLTLAVIFLPIGSGDRIPFRCDLTIEKLLRQVYRQEFFIRSLMIKDPGYDDPIFDQSRFFSDIDPFIGNLNEAKNYRANATWWTQSGKVQSYLGECGYNVYRLFWNDSQPIEFADNDTIEMLEIAVNYSPEDILNAITTKNLSSRCKRSISAEKGGQENSEGRHRITRIQVPCRRSGGIEAERNESKTDEKFRELSRI